MNREDTIAAIATAPGEGGIGIVRISGPGAAGILQQVFVPAGNPEKALESNRLSFGWVRDGNETVDEAMAVIMRAPRSYTREDVAEIQTHGGTFVLNRTLLLCLSKGARLAEPGEFTRRAFLNGRVDLSRAEAVMDLISARGEKQHKAAAQQLNGGTASFIHSFSDELSDLQAGLAACIDYPEEITDEEGAGQLREGLSHLISRLSDAIDERASRLIYQGMQVALVGRPNVGKSSLLNALVGEDLAIVTNIPGTTRDAVRGEMTINGIRIHLTDTAGIRETEDPVERIGVERSEKALREADVTLLVLDGSETMTQEDLVLFSQCTGEKAVIINKSDLDRAVCREEIERRMPGTVCLEVCAYDPESLRPLREYLAKQAEISDRMALVQPRHLDAARRALGLLNDALETLTCFTPDMASTDLQAAQAALCEITGEQADEKLLDRVFSRFCVGK